MPIAIRYQVLSYHINNTSQISSNTLEGLYLSLHIANYNNLVSLFWCHEDNIKNSRSVANGPTVHVVIGFGWTTFSVRLKKLFSSIGALYELTNAYVLASHIASYRHQYSYY